MTNFEDNDIPCNDFLRFSKLLHIWRKADDRINNDLNSTLPTASFAKSVDASKQCANFFDQLSNLHKKRYLNIQRCVAQQTAHVAELKDRYEAGNGEANLPVILRKQQLTLRQFQSELLEEEIIQNSATKVLYERCRDHFNIPAFDKFK